MEILEQQMAGLFAGKALEVVEQGARSRDE
jgi:hypothetical protein